MASVAPSKCSCVLCMQRRVFGCECCSCCCTGMNPELAKALSAVFRAVPKPDQAADEAVDSENIETTADACDPAQDAPLSETATESGEASAAVEVDFSLGDGKKLSEAEITKIESFDDLQLHPQLATSVAKAGYTKPTPIQQYSMGSIQYGKDVMACSQTGSGKTAAFLLPIMNNLIEEGVHERVHNGVCMPRVLILAPTRELALQIHHETSKLAQGVGGSCNTAILYGGTAVAHQKERVLKGATILIGTIGRIRHFIDDGFISLERVKYLVLDEADRLLDMGFSDEIRELMLKGDLPPKKDRQTLMFSASFPAAVQDLARTLLDDDYIMIVVDKMCGAKKNITQEFVHVTRRTKKRVLLQLIGIDLKKADQNQDLQIFKHKTLIFVASKTMADSLGVFLSESGIPTTTIHGDREQDQRQSALDDFRSGRTPILIATAVAERGLDITGLDHVINFDMPKEIIDFVHRIGRTGRVGNKGLATSFIDADNDAEIIDPLRKFLVEAELSVPQWLQDIKTPFIAGGVDDQDSSDEYWKVAGAESADEFDDNMW